MPGRAPTCPVRKAKVVLDPSQAPPGRHTAYAWHVVPYAPDGDHQKLRDLEKPLTEAILAKWRAYAPNMTDANVLRTYTYTAYEPSWPAGSPS
jgi:phytoene dehydrogenase-like protein